MKSLGYSIKFLNITNNDRIIHNSFKKHASFERYFHKIVVPFLKKGKKFMLQTKYFTVLPSSWKKECTFFLLLLLKKGKSEMVFSQIQKSLKYCKEYLRLYVLRYCYQYLRENIPNHLASFSPVRYLCQINFTKLTLSRKFLWNYCFNISSIMPKCIRREVSCLSS